MLSQDERWITRHNVMSVLSLPLTCRSIQRSISLCLRGKPWPRSKLEQPGKSLNWPQIKKGRSISPELQEKAPFLLFPCGHHRLLEKSWREIEAGCSVRCTLINLIIADSQNIINDLKQLDTQLYELQNHPNFPRAAGIDPNWWVRKNTGSWKIHYGLMRFSSESR